MSFFDIFVEKKTVPSFGGGTREEVTPRIPRIIGVK